MLREVLDTTIRSRDELLQLVGVAPLALIPPIATQAGRTTAPAAFFVWRLAPQRVRFAWRWCWCTCSIGLWMWSFSPSCNGWDCK